MCSVLELDVSVYPVIPFNVCFFFQLEEVMETETYKNAKMILERFDPDSKRKNVSYVFTLYHKSLCLIVF